MNWYYIDGPNRLGPLNETEWAELVRTGKIQPGTLVWHEGIDHWTPYSQVTPPEPPALEEEAPEPDEPEIADTFAARVADLDYPVNVGHCISRAWSLFKAHFWLVVGSIWLIYAILIASLQVPVLQIFVGMVLQGVLLGGLYSFYLQLMRGEEAPLSDLFIGFNAGLFKPLALQTLVSYLVSQACFLPGVIAIKMLGVDLDKVNTSMKLADLGLDPQAILVLLLVFLACSIPAIYFTFCWMFSIPLIVDKGLNFWPAMKLSRSKVLQHPWRIGVLSVVAGIIAALGLFAFGIGFFFTLPLQTLIVLYAYEDIFNLPKE